MGWLCLLVSALFLRLTSSFVRGTHQVLFKVETIQQAGGGDPDVVETDIVADTDTTTY